MHEIVYSIISAYFLLVTETINQSFPSTAGSRTMPGM